MFWKEIKQFGLSMKCKHNKGISQMKKTFRQVHERKVFFIWESELWVTVARFRPEKLKQL